MTGMAQLKIGTISTVSACCKQALVEKFVHVICCDFSVTGNLKIQGNWNNWTYYTDVLHLRG